MLKSNRLAQVLLEANRPAMGFWQMLPGTNISRILARAGVDWVMVDCEHGNIDGRKSPVAVKFHRRRQPPRQIVSRLAQMMLLRLGHARMCPRNCCSRRFPHRADTRSPTVDGET